MKQTLNLAIIVFSNCTMCFLLPRFEHNYSFGAYLLPPPLPPQSWIAAQETRKLPYKISTRVVINKIGQYI